MNRIFVLVLGLSLLAFGFGVLIAPDFIDSKHHFYFDFTDIQIPFSIFLMLLGGFFIYLAVIKR